MPSTKPTDIKATSVPGSIATLEEALDRELYYRSLASGIPIALTPDERADLLAFLNAL